MLHRMVVEIRKVGGREGSEGRGRQIRRRWDLKRLKWPQGVVVARQPINGENEKKWKGRERERRRRKLNLLFCWQILSIDIYRQIFTDKFETIKIDKYLYPAINLIDKFCAIINYYLIINHNFLIYFF